MSSPSYAVRNLADDAAIDYASTRQEAERLASQVRSGGYDDNPRECWIDQIDQDSM